MSKSLLKSIGTFIILSMLFSAFLFIIAFILVNVKGYILKDVLLIESIIFVVLGGFASISGNPKGLSIKSMGQSNAQYSGNANLEITRMENEKTKNDVKIIVNNGIGRLSLLFSGIVCMIISFLV